MPDDSVPVQRGSIILDCSDRELKEINHLLNWLRRSDLRRTIQAILKDEPLWPEDIAILLRVLNGADDRKWKERILAAWALRQIALPPKEKENAAEILQSIVSTPREHDSYRAKRIMTWVGRVSVVVAIVEYIGLLLMTNPYTFGDLVLLALICFIFWLVPITVVGLIPITVVTIPTYRAINDTHYNRVRAMAATTLGKLGLRQSIPALVAAACGREKFTFGATPVREAALATLPPLLATLTTEDYGQFDSEVVPNLCRLLRQPSEDVVQSALEALGKIGDERAIKPVEQLCQRAATQGAVTLQETAERVLPLLCQRQQEENNPRILLRATDAPSLPNDTLLRPAQGVPEADPQVLLRASTQEEGSGSTG
jgi:hypothetical protein